jgi:pyrimidine-nucleoside phosphorylase
MRPQEIIAAKRDGKILSEAQIKTFVDGVCDGSWADYQISALIMAMFIRGLDQDEQSDLTRAMLYSGEVLDFSEIDRPKADKHSTGGVGDKTSLIIAPLVASCGVAVPMISGRGLGHTGGTLDKLESIPGYNVTLTTEEFHRIINECGFAMSGQTADIAPADKKIYALRDATATVPYIPLIVASIMSKKLAEGLDALVLDVKTGSGAFMKKYEDSRSLAQAMVATGNTFGVKTQAVISEMGQPLGQYCGNAYEVYECLQILRNEIEPAAEPTWELSLELSARMLALSGVSGDPGSAKSLLRSKLESGDALECFRRNIELQGGNPSVCDDPSVLLEKSLVEYPITAPSSGYLAGTDTFAIGIGIVEIGGGRTRAEDAIDPAVGLRCEARIGDEVKAGDTLGVLLCRSESQAEHVHKKMRDAFTISPEKCGPPRLIKEVIS